MARQYFWETFGQAGKKLRLVCYCHMTIDYGILLLSLFNTRLPINSVCLCTSFISTRHHLISQTLLLRQHQSVLVEGFGSPAIHATSSHGWDLNLVSAVSHMLHQPPGTLHRHHCNNSLTLTHLNGSWKLFFLNEPFLNLPPSFYILFDSLNFDFYFIVYYCKPLVTLCVSGLYCNGLIDYSEYFRALAPWSLMAMAMLPAQSAVKQWMITRVTCCSLFGIMSLLF